jgi:uncharacterized membrane protein YgaE (UPF0421/DUF939 family)
MRHPSRDHALRRLERSVRRRVDLRQRASRLAASVPAVVQITVAATAAYAFARFVLGHEVPVVAVTMTITSLGFARDARPRRVLETVIGMLVGITLSEVILLVLGVGIAQLAFVLVVTMLIARFFSPTASFAVAAATQSMLVVLLPAPDGGVFVRTIDGVVGAVLALLVTALIPRDPRRAARRDARNLFSSLDESLTTVVEALERADEPAADLALTRLRRTQHLVDDWNESLDSALSIARISPFLRRHLPDLRRQQRLLTGLDLASRHLRVITRRIDMLVRDGRARPGLAVVVADIAAGIRLLESDDAAARTTLGRVAAHLDPAEVTPGAEVTESMLVLLLRPLVVDLLVASGLPLDAARGLLPDVG